ncbi:MAG TPA: pyridoxal 5'-phosphate synthase glutaminase subunit PdxT [Solirubrobacteraceae bacterium]|nr:pyridoxal 5'-phosphate synthase glutaminase subunit PdxT [Solirubrobacteraceae bacterium]
MNSASPRDRLRVGVLALQGGFAAHERILAGLGALPCAVRTPNDLEGLDALVMPGGESTVMTLGVQREGLAQPLTDFAAHRPVLATCAGMIMLDRDHLGVLDVRAERNAFGRQLRSFEIDLDFPDGPVHAVFIRAPWIAEHGDGVKILASLDDHPVAIRSGAITALAFHPELSGESRFHTWLLDQATGSRNSSS